jgi:acyl-coenzyme A synthetase/AMP-(fatty) acid ligase
VRADDEQGATGSGSPFVIFEDVTRSRADFDDITARAARMLASRGIGKDDRVAIMASKSDA